MRRLLPLVGRPLPGGRARRRRVRAGPQPHRRPRRPPRCRRQRRSPAAEPDPLAGGWDVLSFDAWGDGLVAPRAGTTLTTVFLPAGRLEGETGCGAYFGGYATGRRSPGPAHHQQGVRSLRRRDDRGGRRLLCRPGGRRRLARGSGRRGAAGRRGCRAPRAGAHRGPRTGRQLASGTLRASQRRADRAARRPAHRADLRAGRHAAGQQRLPPAGGSVHG